MSSAACFASHAIATFSLPISSTSTGRNPVWSRDGKELLFYGMARVMAASYSTNGPTFEPGVVRSWSEAEIGGDAGGRNFGHLAYQVDDIYAVCSRLSGAGVTINRPPRDGHMAFVRSPEGISVELLQKGGSLPKAEPWTSMPNVGVW